LKGVFWCKRAFLAQEHAKKGLTILRAVAILVLCVLTTIAFASGDNDDPSGATEFYPNGSGNGSVDHDGDPVDWWLFMCQQ
jgi:hypothetical protein